MSYEDDYQLLNRALECPLPESTRDSFEDIKAYLQRKRFISPKQRDFVKKVLEEHEPPPCENLVSSGKVARGNEVPLPPSLQNLPKRPPHRRHELL